MSFVTSTLVPMRAPTAAWGCLVQHAAQIFIPFCGATTMVLFRAFVLAGTGSHPGCQLRCRCERAGLSPHLGDDLLRRINSQTERA